MQCESRESNPLSKSSEGSILWSILGRIDSQKKQQNRGPSIPCYASRVYLVYRQMVSDPPLTHEAEASQPATVTLTQEQLDKLLTSTAQKAVQQALQGTAGWACARLLQLKSSLQAITWHTRPCSKTHHYSRHCGLHLPHTSAPSGAPPGQQALLHSPAKQGGFRGGPAQPTHCHHAPACTLYYVGCNWWKGSGPLFQSAYPSSGRDLSPPPSVLHPRCQVVRIKEKSGAGLW